MVYNENTNSIHYINSSNKDGFVVSSVNNKTMFSYPGYNYKGSNFISRNSIDIVSFIPSSESDTWYGGALAPNGKIYVVPSTATNVMIIDTTTED